MRNETDNSTWFGIGLLAGVIGGILAGVLYAPKSGEETRCDLIHKIKVIKNKFPSKIESARKKSINSIEHTKVAIENIIEDIQNLYEDALPKYVPGLHKTTIEKWRSTYNYTAYKECIDDLLDANGIDIPFRHRKLDHYLWYTYRKPTEEDAED